MKGAKAMTQHTNEQEHAPTIPPFSTEEEETKIQKIGNAVLEKLLTSPEKQQKPIKDVVLPGDIYTKGDKVIFRHGGILRMIEFVGAEPQDPQPINGYLNKDSSGFVFYCPIKFPNGEISRWGMGEANEQNTDSFGSSYKANQAIIRGFARSFLHSKNIGLYDVYSEGEADDFNQQVQQIEETNRRNNMLEKTIQSLKGKNQVSSDNNARLNIQMNLLKEIAVLPSASELLLPANDSKYPNTSIITVLADFKDSRHIKECVGNLEDSHSINIVYSFLKKKAEIDQRNNNRYALYSTSIELLKELRLLNPKEKQEPTSIPAEKMKTYESFIDSLNEVNAEAFEEVHPVKEDTITNEKDEITKNQSDENIQTKKNENTKYKNDENSSAGLENKVVNTPPKSQVKESKKTEINLGFLESLDSIINIEELSAQKHEPLKTEKGSAKKESPPKSDNAENADLEGKKNKK